MCGIAGFVGKQEKKDAIIKDMTDLIAHRGPDSSGEYVDGDVALGHRRLSIIDITSAGDQPIFNEEGTLVLVFNGEIYNYRSLRETLIEAGHTFRTNTDSETLIHAYEEWGSAMLDRLRGMFAFVIWDREKKELFGARDLFGIKPLYYYETKGGLLFASEIKAFLPHPDFVKEFNESALGSYLSFQFVPTDETFFKGVYCLPPSHCFTYSGGKMRIERYYHPTFRGDRSEDLETLVNETEKIMEESVAAHKVSDVEVASYLSSGVDSSYLTALSQVDRTFTVGFDESKYSEIAEAKTFADSIGMKNDAKVITSKEYFDSLSDIMWHMDEPLADPSAIALYFLSREAAKHVKVVLSGEGSDELFGGYNIYCEPLEHTGFDRVPKTARRLMGHIAERYLPRGTRGRGFLMRHAKTLEERYFSNATNNFTEREANAILKRGCAPMIRKITAPLYAKVADKDPVTKMQYVDLHLWLVHDILMKGDKMGMANSIEVRVPFLDREVLDFALGLPLDKKVQPPRTKIALREAADRRIRRETAEKKKLGFPIPMREWIREEPYYSRIREAFTSEAASRYFCTEKLVEMLEKHREGKRRDATDDSRKIWTVFIFLVWYERFFSTTNQEA